MKIVLDRPDSYPNCDIPADTLPLIASSFGFVVGSQDGPCVYLIACKKPFHWYVGYTTNPQKRFDQHYYEASSVFVRQNGFRKVVSRVCVGNKEFAQYLESVVYKTLVQVYPCFCISMGCRIHWGEFLEA